MKTNKSFTKRMRITRKGKILVRKAGQNHFNAKSSRRKQLNSKKWRSIPINQRTASRNIPGLASRISRK